MADDYTPDEAHLRAAYRHYDDPARVLDPDMFSAEFDRFIAKVRRDAERAALDGMIVYAETRAQVAITGRGTDEWNATAANIAVLRDTHYPEGAL